MRYFDYHVVYSSELIGDDLMIDHNKSVGNKKHMGTYQSGSLAALGVLWKIKELSLEESKS